MTNETVSIPPEGEGQCPYCGFWFVTEERKCCLAQRDVTKLEADHLEFKDLLAEWRRAADIAKDLNFVHIAKRTDAALA